MEGPFSWEQDLFGSSPEEASPEQFEENVGENSMDSGFTVSGDEHNELVMSTGNTVAPEPQFGLNSEEESYLELGPRTGMVFSDLELIFTAYQAHAKHKGFCITKRTSRKVGVEDYKYTVFVCDRARLSTTKKYSKRVGCPVRVNASRVDDTCWIVGKTVSEHNHELCPNMSVLIPGYRTITINLKRQLEGYDIAGIRVCKNVRLAEVQVGGPLHLGCLPKDYRNYVDARRRLRLGVNFT